MRTSCGLLGICTVKQHGLSTPQIHALMHIYHAGECLVSDIGALADVSNAAASQLVERLVQRCFYHTGSNSPAYPNIEKGKDGNHA